MRILKLAVFCAVALMLSVAYGAEIKAGSQSEKAPSKEQKSNQITEGKVDLTVSGMT